MTPPDTGEQTMRYMLMMHAPRGNGEYAVGDWAPQDLKAHLDFMLRLNRELTDKGEFVAGEGLTATMVCMVSLSMTPQGIHVVSVVDNKSRTNAKLSRADATLTAQRQA